MLPFWLSHLVATLLASATERCGSSGRTPSPGGGAWRGVGEEHRVRRARRWRVGIEGWGSEAAVGEKPLCVPQRSPILLAYTSSPSSRLGRARVESCTGSAWAFDIVLRIAVERNLKHVIR